MNAVRRWSFWVPWRHLTAAALFLSGFGLVGYGFGMTFLRVETASPLMATVSFVIWGVAALAFLGAVHLHKGGTT